MILPPATVSDCLMVLQFLHSFGKTLRLDIDAHMLNPRDLQEGLLNIGENAGRLQDTLVRMLSVAVNDPGMPAGHKVSGWQRHVRSPDGTEIGLIIAGFTCSVVFLHDWPYCFL